MRRPAWRLMALGLAAAVLAASCSTSTPTSAAKHPKAHHASAPPSTTTTISKSTVTKGVDGNGSSITGDTGAGTNTGQGLALPGTSDTSGGTSTTVAGGTPTTTMAGFGPNSATTTGPAPGSTTSPTVIRVTKTGRVIYHHLAPSIARFRPPSSPVGAIVVIVGKRLAHATSVSFDGLRATITFNSSTRIKAVVPIGATTGPISVVTAGGSVTVSGFVVD
ncbi:MAG TPA: hypothetical protein VMU64_02445 [Acidimicrobiales bacterium]|nr:hypothetical protein [Acidimicrobiales bacterium]